MQALLFAPVVAGAFAVISRWMYLSFMRHVYDRGGAKDVERVAKAMRRELPRRAHREDLPTSEAEDAPA